jgi:hypothetical protein
VDILDAGGLGADIALTEDVIPVPTDGQDLLAIVLNFNAAHGFTQMAGTVMKLVHGGSPGLHLYWDQTWQTGQALTVQYLTSKLLINQ